MPVIEPVVLRVEFERDASPVTGQVAGLAAPDRPFQGWTELFAALQAALAEVEPSTGNPRAAAGLFCGEGERRLDHGPRRPKRRWLGEAHS